MGACVREGEPEEWTVEEWGSAGSAPGTGLFALSADEELIHREIFSEGETQKKKVSRNRWWRESASIKKNCSWTSVIALNVFVVVPFFFSLLENLFVSFSPASPHPHTSLKLDLGASISPLSPLSPCSWLLVFFPGTKCRRFFAANLASLPWTALPSRLYCSLYIPYIPAVSKCSILESFLEFTLSSYIQVFIKNVLPFRFSFSFFFQSLTFLFVVFRVSLVGRCVAGSPLCCWGGIWQWCCAL